MIPISNFGAADHIWRGRFGWAIATTAGGAASVGGARPRLGERLWLGRSGPRLAVPVRLGWRRWLGGRGYLGLALGLGLGLELGPGGGVRSKRMNCSRTVGSPPM